MYKEFAERQERIDSVANVFEKSINNKLGLITVQGPLMVKKGGGLQDNLSGMEKSVKVNVKSLNEEVEIVHSLAKWKRLTLTKYDFPVNNGININMKALRPDEDVLDSTHSVYVDQWDWEKVISQDCRNLDYLKDTVKLIYDSIKETEQYVFEKYGIEKKLPDDILFVHAEDLLEMYPDMTPEEREHNIAKKHKAVFIIGIGFSLKNGLPHGSRSPDYDDWSTETKDGLHGLNGDIIVWNDITNDAFELSSMGVRVNKTSLLTQLTIAKEDDKVDLEYHKMLLDDKMKQTVGGGIGRSRLIMFLLGFKHIGEAQCSVWDDKTLLENSNILI